MELVVVHLEMLVLSAILVGLYGLRRSLGLVPLYMAVGLLVVWLMVGGRVGLTVLVPGGASLNYTSLHMSVLLAAVGLVYALEGTSEARRMIASIAISTAILYAMRGALAWHLLRPDRALDVMGRGRWIDPTVFGFAVSVLGLVASGIAIIVVYQTLHNRLEWMPHFLKLTVALLVAMAVDAVVYGGLSGQFEATRIGAHLAGKLSVGLAACLPVGTFIAWSFKQNPEALEDGVLERGAFEIVRLQRRVKHAEQELIRTRAEYEELRSVFGRYVAPDVVDEILEDSAAIELGGETRDVTILFSDIEGYSTLSEQLAPAQTIALLNRYFGAMSEVIHAERGTIIEFEGDAILVVFGAPLAQDDHAARAVRVGLAMLERVVELNRAWDTDGTSQKWRELDIDAFRIRLGIHSGPVVVGNVGSESRTKYAVIGDTVNTAHRIESLNKTFETRLLLSQTTLDELRRTGDDDIDVRDLGSHTVKGRVEPVHVYTVDRLPTFDRRDEEDLGEDAA